MAFLTPLRYPGGKGRLGPWLAELMRYNGLGGGCFVEPYAGGAGAAIYLLVEGYVDHIVINDLDPAVHAFWWAVLNDTDNFIRLINETPVTVESWRRQREILASPEKHSTTELGFAVFFLSRTSWSGILAAGVMGGKGQKGRFKIDARFNKRDLVRRIQRIAMRRRHVSLFHLDALELIDVLVDSLPKKTLLFFDPPYYAKGSLLYKCCGERDHLRIAEKVADLTRPWLVAYDDCEFIRGLYGEYPAVTFSVPYSAGVNRPRAVEVMFYGNLVLHREPYLRR